MPIAQWIAYALVVGVLLGAAALAADGLCRLAGRPTRWVWSGALLLTVLLTALAPLRATRERFTVELPAGALVPTVTESRRDAAAPLADAVRALRQTVTRPVQNALAALEQRVPAQLEPWLAAGWLSLTAVLLALFGTVYARVRRARRGWPSAKLQGHPVRVAPSAGPAVVGLLRPQIVVPSWLLCRSPDEQRLVLAHEQEHVRARDPLLLAAGCTIAALLPWHPAIWWMLSRLRLSVELDCDRRLLGRGGIAAGRYGTLLIDLAGRCAGLPLAAPALAERSSHLERRLLAMTSRPTRFPFARGIALAAVAGLAVLAACESKLPTSAEIERMDLAAAEHGAREAAFVHAVGDSAALYTVDGVRVTAEQAHALPADKILSIEIRKMNDGEQNRVLILTKIGAAASDSGERFTLRLRPTVEGALTPDGARRGETAATFEMRVPAPGTAAEDRFAGLIFIDGVRADRAAMRALKPDQIQSIDVLKAERATALYSEPEAANGVIKITTKRAAQ